MELEPFEHARFLADAWQHGAPKHNLGSSGLHVDWPELPAPHIDDLNGLILHDATDLRDRLAARWDLPADQMLVTAGTTGANLAAVTAAVRPGHTVVAERPTYMPLPNVAKALGADIRWVDRDAACALDADAVAKAIDASTTAVLLTSPNNPTGHEMAAADLIHIAEAASEVDALVIVDQVYQELGGGPIAAKLHPSCVSTSGFNKCWGAPGIRVGWVAGEQLRERDLPNVHSQLVLAASGHGQRAAHWLLEREAECRARLHDHMRASHEAAHAWAEATGRPLHVGPLTAWLQVDAECVPLARRLVDQGILTVPGAFFGAPGHLRLGLGGDLIALAASLEALEAGLTTQRS